jgi:copper homeostasis protein
MLLEICAFNIQSCIIAARAGAGRIELCAGPLQGGTTPGYGLIQYTLDKIAIPVFPMIRPRGGNFIYDDDEIAIMKKDILACRESGCVGIVTGVQLADGRIDTERLKRFVEWAHPMTVTCHKVFDGTPDAFAALEDVIAAGCTRVLTSGLCGTASEGLSTLAALAVHAAGRIIIMPGGGVRSSNIAQLAATANLNEFHSSAILSRGANDIADEQEISLMVHNLRARKSGI